MINFEGFTPLVFEAMRITENSVSCIDHNHSNFISFSTSGSIAYKVPDHLPVFSVVYDPKHQPFPNTIEYNYCAIRSLEISRHCKTQYLQMCYDHQLSLEQHSNFLCL